MTAAYAAAYDAWNRLVEVKDGSNVVLKCEYDGLGRRTKTFVNTSDPLDQTYDEYLHFFYNSGWQILETRRSGSENTGPETLDVETQYVWSRRYIDAPVLRDRDAGAGGDLGVTDSRLDERLYYTTDANMNVTALLDTGNWSDFDEDADGDGQSLLGRSSVFRPLPARPRPAPAPAAPDPGARSQTDGPHSCGRPSRLRLPLIPHIPVVATARGRRTPRGKGGPLPPSPPYHPHHISRRPMA